MMKNTSVLCICFHSFELKCKETVVPRWLVPSLHWDAFWFPSLFKKGCVYGLSAPCLYLPCKKKKKDPFSLSSSLPTNAGLLQTTSSQAPCIIFFWTLWAMVSPLFPLYSTIRKPCFNLTNTMLKEIKG